MESGIKASSLGSVKPFGDEAIPAGLGWIALPIVDPADRLVVLRRMGRIFPDQGKLEFQNLANVLTGKNAQVGVFTLEIWVGL